MGYRVAHLPRNLGSVRNHQREEKRLRASRPLSFLLLSHLVDLVTFYSCLLCDKKMSEEVCENSAITGYTGSDPEDCDFVEADIGDDSDTGEDCFYNGDEPSTAEITEVPSLLETEASPTPEVRTEPILTPETSRDEEKEKDDRKKKQKGKWKNGGGGGG
ncbi:uncharacterized protein LOC119586582, partial [Penaeus monodon]|uniref:uncharacterized protein LOC119586582 n=1 Tax=Penaeus monodon TaxID=6687 RepID=UPI0018A6F266